MNNEYLNQSLLEGQFFNDEKMKEIKECFRMFDKDKDNFIKINELKNVLRALNHDITDDDLIDVIKEIKDLKTNKLGDPVISYNQFEYLLIQLLREDDITQELSDAFLNFTKEGQDYIPVDDFEHYMKTLGDKLSDEEVEEMIKDFDPNKTGYVKCSDFVRLMTSK